MRTGVTAVLPHGGNFFREKVPAAVHVGNAFGKLIDADRSAPGVGDAVFLTSTLSATRKYRVVR